MNNLVKLLLLSLMLVKSAFAESFEYQEVKDWHHNIIKNVIKINSLENKLDFAVEIVSINEKKVQKIEKPLIKLPGLLINKPKEEEPIVEKGLFSKEDTKDYKRDLTLLMIYDLSPDVIEKVNQQLRTSLNFTDKDTFRLVKTFPPQTPAVKFQEMKSDAAAGLYENLVKKSFLIWILMMCGLTLYVLWELRRIFHESTSRLTDSINELKNKTAAEAQMQEDAKEKDNKPQDGLTTSIYRDEFKPDTSVLVMNLFISIRKHPGHLLASIYKVFDDQETMIKFFSFIDQSEVSDSTKKQKEVVLDFLKQLVLAINGLRIASATVDINDKIRVISDVMTALKFLKINPKAEKIYQAVFFKARNRYYQIIEKLAEDYFEIIYMLFPDDLKIYMNDYRENMKEYSSRIMDVLASGLSIEDIDDLQVQKFLNDVALIDLYSTKTSLNDESFTKMLFYLSDVELADMENETNSSMIFKIPKISWLKGSDRSVLKQFVVSLLPDELKLFSQSVNNFAKIIQEFEPRVAFRIKETLSIPIEDNENSWHNLRHKIAKFYKAPVRVEESVAAVDTHEETLVKVPEIEANQMNAMMSNSGDQAKISAPQMKPLPSTPDAEAAEVNEELPNSEPANEVATNDVPPNDVPPSELQATESEGDVTTEDGNDDENKKAS